jgi:dienelactone hydrolase
MHAHVTEFEAFVSRLTDATLPGIEVSPDGRWTALFLPEARGRIDDLRQPCQWIGGFAINPLTHGPYIQSAARTLTLIENPTGICCPVKLPVEASLYSCGFSGTAVYFAVAAVTYDGVELFCIHCASGHVRSVPGLKLNGCWLALDSPPARWCGATHQLVCRSVPKPIPRRAQTRFHRAAAVYDSRESAGWVYRVDHSIRGSSRLLNDHDLRECFESQIEIVDMEVGTRRAVGDPEVCFAVNMSPDAAHLLVQRCRPPFHPDTMLTAFARMIDVWDASTGRMLWRNETDAATSEIGARVNRSAWQWDPFETATLVWIERRARLPDAVVALAAPFDEERQIYQSDDPCHRLAFTTAGNLIVWTLNTSGTTTIRYVSAEDGAASSLGEVPVVASGNRRSQSLATLGVGVLAASPSAQSLIVEHKQCIYIHRQHLIDGYWQADVQQVECVSGATRDVWQSAASRFEVAVSVMPDAQALVIATEAADEAPRFVLQPIGSSSMASSLPRRPVAMVVRPEERLLSYTRDDGITLEAMHYRAAHLAADAPCLIWIYPNVDRIADVDYVTTRHRYVGFENFAPVPPLDFLARGFSVVPFAPMPVTGMGDALLESLIEQLIADATALADVLFAERLATPGRLVIGGHGLGGWAVAILLAHTSLFAAGVSCSGAYTAPNMLIAPGRRIYRELWRRGDLLQQLSPLGWAEKIRRPLLLVHGEREGPAPVDSAKESRDLFAAIATAGGTVRCVSLPYEEHAYVAPESKWRLMEETATWFSQHVS